MKVTSLTTQAYRPSARAAEPKPPDQEIPQEKQPPEWADAAGYAIGGAVGLAVGIPALYAGTLGGAALGGLIGGGLGPIVASISSEGALGFIGTTFATAGALTRAGIVVGGLTGLIGAFDLGRRVGNSIQKTAGWATGTGEEPQLKRADKGFTGPSQLVASALCGAGTVAGGAGGFLVGAAVGSLGSLFSGGGLGAAAGVGGAVGGLAFGVLGGWGGLKLARGVLKAGGATGKFAGNAVGPLLGSRYQRVKAVATEEERQTQEKKQLDRRQWTVEKQELTSATQHERASGALAEREKQATAELDQLNRTIGQEARNRFEAAHPEIVEERASLTRQQQELQTREADLKTREEGLAALVDSKASAIVEAERPAVEEAFRQEKSRLDTEHGRVTAEEKTLLQNLRREVAPRLARESIRLRDELTETREKERRALAYRDAVRGASDRAARQRQQLEQELSTAQQERDYWKRLLEQLPNAQEGQKS
ncbi:MAG: hypothetical protein HY319_04845 [Armatimonadetes bacterium]|nr:hypothetical protein [Armatimonadota bacterium]